MYKKIFTLTLLLLLAYIANAQVKIGLNPTQISKASILELESTNKGLLLPRIQDTLLLDSLNPPDGLMIFIKDLNNNQNTLIRKNGKWETLQLVSQSNLNLGNMNMVLGGTYTNLTGLNGLTSTNIYATNLTTTNITGTLSGTASSANKLSIPRSINGIPFDGSADITIPTSSINNLNNINLGTTNMILGGTYTNVTGLSSLTSINITANNITGTLSGTATSANTLSTPRNINGIPFDGSSDITIPTNSINNLNNINLGATNMILGGTYTNVTGLNSLTSTNITGTLSGTASKANLLTTARSINGVPFDGSADITVSTPSNNEWYLAGTTTEAGNNKTSAIYRTGSIGVGTNSPTANLDIAAGTTTAVTGINLSGSINDFLQYNVKNTSTGIGAQSGYSATADNGTDASGFAWMGINNSTFNNPQTYNIGIANDVTYIGSGNDMYIANANSNKSIIFSAGKSTTPYFTERMRIAPSGSVGIGNANPLSTLHVQNSLNATNTINANANVLRLSRATTTNYKWDNIAQFSLGSYSTSILAHSRLDLSLTNGPDNSTLTNVMTWNANGNVGVGNTAPAGRLVINDNSYISSIPTSAANLIDNTNYRPVERSQVTDATNNNALSHYFTSSVIASQAHNFLTGATLTYALQPAGGLLTIGGNFNLTGIKSNTTSPTVITTNASGIDNILSINANGEVYKRPSVLTTTISANSATFSYTLSTLDNNSVIFVSTNSTSNYNATINIPNGMPPGFICQIINDGTGALNFVATGGITLNSANGLNARTANSAVGIVYKSNTVAYITGDTAP